MNKLFVFQDSAAPEYASELESAYNLCKGGKDVCKFNLTQLTIEHLRSIDVVISNSLPFQWQVVLSGLKIVSIVIDRIEKNDDYTDIYIDYLYKGSDRFFIGDNYSICGDNGQDINFKEIFELINLLRWDTDYWGFPVAYLSSRHLSDNILFRVNKFVRNSNIRLVEYLCNCHDKRSVGLAEVNNYEFKDIRLAYEKSLNGVSPPELSDGIEFGVAEKNHIPALRKISRDIYLDSRYYFDENFDKNKIREFYMSWVAKAVNKEFDDECYVLFGGQHPMAYCTVKYEGYGVAHIGLVGVANGHSGKGIGGMLLNMVFNDLYEKGLGRVRVVTQGRNYAAQRLYQKAGFLALSTELWYHKWVY